MDQLVGFLLHPPLSDIGKKIGKNLKQDQRRAAMDRRMHCIIPNESYNINHNTLYIFMT